ncbi:hypothetical protein [Mycobacteroides abscessus]|uniref:hypothetical protein n=1 Tax=Mycobacteroides abscessus TaxID=36809 RepID=UPI0009A59355|nr:hypothetical protein [Mycobacteroides abscessus]
MDLHTIRQKIIDSTREDWNKITCWGSGSGPSYHYGLASEQGENGVETEAKDHGNIAVLIEDVDITIEWGLDPDESLWFNGAPRDFDFSDFLPTFPDKDARRMYVDIFYRGNLVDRELYVVADGARYYVPIPRTTYPNKTGHGFTADEVGAPEHHYTNWDIGLARVVNSFGHPPGSFDELLSRMEYVLDVDRPIWAEGK